MKVYTQGELFKRRDNGGPDARYYAPEKVREVSRKNPGYLQSSPLLLSDRERPDPGGVGDVADYKGPRTRSGS